MNLIIRPEDQRSEDEVAADREIINAAGQLRRLCACGRMFTPYRSFQRYCCEAHRIKYGKGKTSSYIKKAIVTKRCKECGKEFQTNDGKRHYCSDECYAEYQRKRRATPEVRRCLVCDKEFVSTHWSKRYCSAECRMEARKL